jgi:5-methylcytosine-specific restriction endonuclease McrA
MNAKISKALRDLVFERDSYTCIVCERAATDLHHVRRRSRGGRDVVQNLVALCRVHHDIAHGTVYPQELNFLRTHEVETAIFEYICDYYASEIEKVGVYRFFGGG